MGETSVDTPTLFPRWRLGTKLHVPIHNWSTTPKTSKGHTTSIVEYLECYSYIYTMAKSLTPWLIHKFAHKAMTINTLDLYYRRPARCLTKTQLKCKHGWVKYHSAVGLPSCEDTHFTIAGNISLWTIWTVTTQHKNFKIFSRWCSEDLGGSRSESNQISFC